jgi:hypothetical protein
MNDARTAIRARIETIEKSYEYFLAYAAQGLTTDQGAKSGAQLRGFVSKLEQALDGLGDALAEVDPAPDPADAWQDLCAVVQADVRASLAAVRLVAARAGISSQLIDNLNANVHLRALLTDLFIVDDLLDS